MPQKRETIEMLTISIDEATRLELSKTVGPAWRPHITFGGYGFQSQIAGVIRNLAKHGNVNTSIRRMPQFLAELFPDAKFIVTSKMKEASRYFEDATDEDAIRQRAGKASNGRIIRSTRGL